MEIYISSYKNFPKIPQNVMCVGVSKSVPKDFQTTSIRNYMYAPRSILSGEFPKDNSLTKEQFLLMFTQHLHNKVSKEYGNVRNYFAKMFMEFAQMYNGEFKGFCFLGEDEYSETDMTFFVRKMLEQLGYSVKTFGYVVKTNTDETLF